MAEISTRPYLIRAIHDWCIDNGYTPYIAVAVDEHTQVPREYVRNGEIVLNVSPAATNRLAIGNELISFQARFGGVARELTIPVANVSAIYARENGHGMAFDVPKPAPAGQPRPAVAGDEPREAGGRRERGGRPSIVATTPAEPTAGDSPVEGGDAPESAGTKRPPAPVIALAPALEPESPAPGPGPQQAQPDTDGGASEPSTDDSGPPAGQGGGRGRSGGGKPRLTRVK